MLVIYIDLFQEGGRVYYAKICMVFIIYIDLFLEPILFDEHFYCTIYILTS